MICSFSPLGHSSYISQVPYILSSISPTIPSFFIVKNIFYFLLFLFCISTSLDYVFLYRIQILWSVAPCASTIESLDQSSFLFENTSNGPTTIAMCVALYTEDSNHVEIKDNMSVLKHESLSGYVMNVAKLVFRLSFMTFMTYPNNVYSHFKHYIKHTLQLMCISYIRFCYLLFNHVYFRFEITFNITIDYMHKKNVTITILCYPSQTKLRQQELN